MTDTFTPRTPSNAPDTEGGKRSSRGGKREWRKRNRKGRKRVRERGFHKHRDKFFERQPNYTRIQKDYKFKGDGLRRIRNSIPCEN